MPAMPPSALSQVFPLFTQEHEMFQASVRRFVRDCVEPVASAWEESGFVPREVLRQMGELGFLGVRYPAEYGGAEMDTLATVVLAEELGRSTFGGFAVTVLVHTDMASPHLFHAGTKAQQQRYLPDIIAGKKIAAVAMTEADAGSDLQGMRTVARREGDEWVLNGVKQFITSGKHADMAIVFAVTDKAAGKKGISCFLVPANAPGYQVGRIEEKMGQKASDTTQILLENCRIPADSMIGDEGQGYKIALANLEAGRIGIAAQWLGWARAALEAAVKYALERESFGKPIFEHQAVNFRLADMATQLEAARQLVWHAASLKDAGRPCLKEASMAKLFASEMAERVCSDAIQVHGGYGYVTDFPVERIYRDVRVCQIYEGASDIQKLVIGRALAG